MKRWLVGVGLTGVVAASAGCAELMTKIGYAAGAAMTQKTDDLSNVSMQAHFVTNLFPQTVKTIETDAWADRWQTGGGLVYVNCLKRSGVGMYELDGTVTARKGNAAPEALTYGGLGSYSLVLPPGNSTPRTVAITTSNGQSASFVLKPAPSIKLKAINGKGAGATMVMGKDVVLDLDLGPDKTAGKLKVGLIASSIGIRNVADVGVFRLANRIVIPGAAFRHLSQTASADAAVQVVTGENMLLVERFQDELPAKAPIGALQTVGKSWSSLPITVTGDGGSRNGFDIASKKDDGGISYRMHKSNAFYSRPIAAAKKLALGGLRVRGTLFKQTSSQSTSYGYESITTTTTTTTWQFPKLPDATWDAALAQLNGDLKTLFKSEFGIDLMPPTKVAASPTFQALEPFDEQNDHVYIERNLPGTRSVFPLSAEAIFKSVSSTFAADRPLSRVIREAGVDGILTAQLDLQVASKKGGSEIVLLPRLDFSIAGPPNGYVVGPTVHVSGHVALDDGIPFNEAQLKVPGALYRVVRGPDLVRAFRKALQEFKAKETAEGYAAIWALN